jgi:hypothetical protein
LSPHVRTKSHGEITRLIEACSSGEREVFDRLIPRRPPPGKRRPKRLFYRMLKNQTVIARFEREDTRRRYGDLSYLESLQLFEAMWAHAAAIDRAIEIEIAGERVPFSTGDWSEEFAAIPGREGMPAMIRRLKRS